MVSFKQTPIKGETELKNVSIFKIFKLIALSPSKTEIIITPCIHSRSRYKFTFPCFLFFFLLANTFLPFLRRLSDVLHSMPYDFFKKSNETLNSISPQYYWLLSMPTASILASSPQSPLSEAPIDSFTQTW